jgi:hypothetical protein
MKRHSLLIPLPLFLLLTACGEAPKAQKAPEKPAEAVSAQFSFHQMFLYARNWAPDAQPLRLASVAIPEVKAKDGKYGAWQATFISPSRSRARDITYSAAESGGNLHKGVFAAQERGWSGPVGQAKPFLVQAFKVDATSAYETAMKQKATQEYVKKHPDMTVNFVMEYISRFPNPAWRVIWGESAAISNFSVYVDAATGDFLEIIR